MLTRIQFINILKHTALLTNSGKTVILCWIFGNVGIPGNERADRVKLSSVSQSFNVIATHAHVLRLACVR